MPRGVVRTHSQIVLKPSIHDNVLVYLKREQNAPWRYFVRMLLIYRVPQRNGSITPVSSRNFRGRSDPHTFTPYTPDFRDAHNPDVACNSVCSIKILCGLTPTHTRLAYSYP